MMDCSWKWNCPYNVVTLLVLERMPEIETTVPYCVVARPACNSSIHQRMNRRPRPLGRLSLFVHCSQSIKYLLYIAQSACTCLLIVCTTWWWNAHTVYMSMNNCYCFTAGYCWLLSVFVWHHQSSINDDRINQWWRKRLTRLVKLLAQHNRLRAWYVLVIRT